MAKKDKKSQDKVSVKSKAGSKNGGALPIDEERPEPGSIWCSCWGIVIGHAGKAVNWIALADILDLLGPDNFGWRKDDGTILRNDDYFNGGFRWIAIVCCLLASLVSSLILLHPCFPHQCVKDQLNKGYVIRWRFAQAMIVLGGVVSWGAIPAIIYLLFSAEHNKLSSGINGFYLFMGIDFCLGQLGVWPTLLKIREYNAKVVKFCQNHYGEEPDVVTINYNH